jgi:transposase
MLTLARASRLFIATRPTDLRKSFDGLATLVEGQFGRQVRSGDAFIFLNKRATQVRMLFWDRDGFCIVMKRLEAGTFRRVTAVDTGVDHVEIEPAEFSMLLDGIDVQVLRRRKRLRTA